MTKMEADKLERVHMSSKYERVLIGMCLLQLSESNYTHNFIQFCTQFD